MKNDKVDEQLDALFNSLDEDIKKRLATKHAMTKEIFLKELFPCLPEAKSFIDTHKGKNK